MKRNLSVLLAAAAVLSVLGACKPPFEPSLDENFSKQEQMVKNEYFTVAVSGTPVTLDVTTGTGGIGGQAAQTITLVTTAINRKTNSPVTPNPGNLVINKDGKIDGVNVYVLSDGGAGAIHTQGAAMDYKATVSGANTVDLVFPFTESGIRNDILLKIDPTLAAFNTAAGKGLLNTDGDIVYGEAGEDEFIEYISVNNHTGAVLTSSRARWPVNASNTLSSNQTFSFPTTSPLNKVGGSGAQITSFSPITGANTTSSFNANDLASAYKFQKYDFTNKAWIDQAISNPTIATAGTLGFNLPQSALYDFYRYQIDKYKIVEASAVLGYIHRASYDQSAGYGGGPTWTVGEYTYANIVVNYDSGDATYVPFVPTIYTDWTVTHGGIKGAYYIDVAFTGTIPSLTTDTTATLVEGSLTTENRNIEVYYYEDGNINDSTHHNKINIKDADIKYQWPLTYRIQLPANFVPETGNYIQVRMNDVKISYSTGNGGAKKDFTNVKVFSPSASDGYLKVSTTF